MRAGAAAAAAGAAVAEGPPCAELAASMADESARLTAESVLMNLPEDGATASDADQARSSTKRKKRADGQDCDGKVNGMEKSATEATGDETDGDIVAAPKTPAKIFGGVRTRSRARTA